MEVLVKRAQYSSALRKGDKFIRKRYTFTDFSDGNEGLCSQKAIVFISGYNPKNTSLNTIICYSGLSTSLLKNGQFVFKEYKTRSIILSKFLLKQRRLKNE